MKTTLNHNVIETFQRQPAWREFIEAIINCCSGLYDNHLIAIADDDTDSMSEYTLFDVLHNNPKALGLYEIVNNRYVLTPDVVVREHKTYYTKAIDNSIMPLHSVFDYINGNVSPVQKENISLKGLLHTLSMYGCRIKDIELKDSNLPHTYKLSRHFLIKTPYGYYENDMESDYIAQAIVDNVGGQSIGCLVEGESDDIVDYNYIHDIYGYNQKNPIILMSQIKEVKEYARFVKKQDSTHSSYPSNVYADFNEYANPNLLYWSDNNGKSGIKPISIIIANNIKEDLASDYTLQQTNGVTTCVKKWVYIEDENSPLRETAYILSDKSKYDLMLNDRIIYNMSDGESNYSVSLAITNSTQPQKLNIAKNPLSVSTYETIGSLSGTSDDAKTYYVYKDFLYQKEWVVMDSVEDYFNISLPYLKSQVFGDECALKTQPLFEYDDWKGQPLPTKMVSMCANTMASEVQGGVGNLTYEVEKYEELKVSTKAETKNNADDWSSYLYMNEIKGVYYGDYFYKWEQFTESNDMFVKEVFTPLHFAKNNVDKNLLSYFFDGGRNVYYINPSDSNYLNNKEKEINGVKYVNTFKQEFFETMYFNHFIKVYPIDAVVDNQVVKTKKLYCDNLELVQFGDIVPYVVSYFRKGENEEDVEANGLYNDIDCSIFSKILSYNKRTHLITLEDYIYFSSDTEQQNLVVAYQNASPFNKIQSLTIVAPDSVKDVVSTLLEDYKNDFKYQFSLITESEYQEL